MEKKTISRAEYLQLVGLFTVAKKYERIINEMAIAISDIVNPEREDKSGTNDYVSDEIYGTKDPNPDRLLSNLSMTVEPESKVVNADS